MHLMDYVVYKLVLGFILDLLYLKHTKYIKCRYDKIIYRYIMSFCSLTSSVGTSLNLSTVYIAAL